MSKNEKNLTIYNVDTETYMPLPYADGGIKAGFPSPAQDYIHNTKHRMPAILSQEDEEKWLDPKLDKSDIEQLLLPFPADQMDAYIIEKTF